MRKTRTTCSKCGKDVKKLRLLKRINGDWLCKECYKKRIKEKRENLKRNILGITKEQELEENREIKNKYNRVRWKKQKKEINKIREPIVPKIKGAKIKRYSRQLHNYLTKEEKNILYKKYVAQGLDDGQINIRLNNIKNYLKEYVKKLIKKKETDEMINIKFKEEFAKLIEQEW